MLFSATLFKQVHRESESHGYVQNITLYEVSFRSTNFARLVPVAAHQVCCWEQCVCIPCTFSFPSYEY